jgi:hypothetical protein
MPDIMAIDEKVNPQVVPVRQPSHLVCWAAGGTMMVSWRLNTPTMTVGAMLDGLLDGNWRKLFDDNKPLSGEQFRTFAAALDLVEEGPMSYTPEKLAQQLKSKGPLLEIGDDGIRDNLIVHIRVITAVKGDGTDDHTNVTLADPDGGITYTERFTEFARRHEAEEAVQLGIGVFHY